MNSDQERKLRVVLDYCIGWTAAFLFLSIVRGVGTEEIGSLKFDLQSSLQIALILGPIMGLVSGLSELWMEEKVYRRISIGRFLLLRLIYAAFFLVALVIAAYWVYQLFFGTDIDIISFAIDDGSFAIYFYVLSVDLFLNTVRQVSLMLGRGNLSKLLTGRFYHPREEDRIFMFIDLQSSTELAEKLGHIKYSLLIQDCFDDLGVVAADGAEVYQYVGDEAVLTWTWVEGVAKEGCINAFYRFKNQIQRRHDHYKEHYDVQPFFKAGIHAGTVTVTEIGKYKKEIAYHGDPINTAARIQGQCNVLGEELLISAYLRDHIQSHQYKLTSVGSILLKGKQETVQIFSVRRPSSPPF
ncbi:MAG: adenylate/guanylate cyclase domain-containing protein [Bacteroidota bacterium]